jgi:hypothetical protein
VKPEEKLFVALCHKGEYAVCLKATSKVALYINSPALLKGVVYYEPGVVPCFTVPTAIQPDNQFAISHSSIVDAHRCNILGTHLLPASFELQLRDAIKHSATLNNRERQRLIDMLSTF